MQNNVLVAQSGGPTAAINATLAGVATEVLHKYGKGRLFGALNGIQGVLEERFVDLTQPLSDEVQLKRLAHTPASALGSCRHKLAESSCNPAEYERIFSVLEKFGVGLFVYIGGNDSMDTVDKLSRYATEKGIKDVRIVGAPKTIDNDLCETDHTPGFGSAVKYVATTLAEITHDCRVYNTPSLTIVEIMGRDAGWLTAGAALAGYAGKGPDFIYLPECPFEEERFMCNVAERMKAQGAVVVALSEGLKTPSGEYVGALASKKDRDAFGHSQLAGVSGHLIDRAAAQLHCKVRSVQLNVMQRCAAHIASMTDLSEAKELGSVAARAGLKGETGVMSSIQRAASKPYAVCYGTVPVNRVANRVKQVPESWIAPEGNAVTAEMLEYLLPLIQGETQLEYENGLPVFYSV